MLKLLNEASETKQKAEEELTEYKAQRNDRYGDMSRMDMSRIDMESRMDKSFKDPGLMESPKSSKLMNSLAGAASQSKAIP